MRAFHYRLSVVLRRARHREQALQIEVARLENQLEDAARRAQALRASRDRLRARLRSLHARSSSPVRVPQASASPLDIGRVLALRRDLDRIDEALARAAALRRAIEQHIAAARERLLDAARSRQVFENHRDAAARTHVHAERAAETKRLDDLTGARFSSRGRSPGPTAGGPAGGGL